MAFVITMPKLSDTMEEGGIASWLKKEGDFVEEGDPLAEIETDKATMEYESPEEGYLLKILVQPGKSSALNAPIAVFGKENGESFDLDALLGSGGVKADSTKAEASKTAGGDKAEKSSSNVVDLPRRDNQPSSPKSPVQAAKGAKGQSTQGGAEDGSRVKASPLARKVASDNGLEISALQGSGPNGRVILRDVEEAMSAGESGRRGVSEVVEKSMPQPFAAQAGAGDQIVPVSMMRKTIAKRLHAAKNDAPHFYLTRSIDMTKCEAWRKSLNSDPQVAAGKVAKVSVNDLVLLAVGKALRKHPGVNSSWQGDHIVQFGGVHVAMAVALPTGLVTPVIRNTDHLGVREIARQARELATKAKNNELGNEDYAGGTFTVSNLGMFGIEEFTAIINPPQAAILAVGATLATPAVNEHGAVVALPRMKVTMSCDHRVVDGAIGAQFLQSFVSYLEDPMMMIT